MSGSNHPLLWMRSDRGRRRVLAAILSVFVLGACSRAHAQEEPPLVVPKSSPFGRPTDAIPFGGWLLYPTLRVYSFYDSNLYQSAFSPIAAAGFRINPALVASCS